MQKATNADKFLGEMNIYMSLVKMQTSTTIMENSTDIPEKAENRNST